MDKKPKNTRQANQIYGLMNVLNLLFMSYVVLRILKIIDFGVWESDKYWIFIFAFVILLNILNRYAVKVGGVQNPIRKNKLARILDIMGLVMFLGGMAGLIFIRGSFPTYITISCIPLKLTALFIGHNSEGTNEDDDWDLVDTFEND